MRALAMLSVAMSLAAGAPAMAAGDGIALCSRCPGTTLIELTGADTDDARAVARVTEQDMRSFCQGLFPNATEQDMAACTRHVSRYEAVEATASCNGGQITIAGEQWTQELHMWISEEGDYHGPGSERHDNVQANWRLLCPNSEVHEGPTD